MTRSTGALARRYARALLEVAAAKGQTTPLELRDELRGFASELEAHAGLRRALAQPTLGAEAKRKLVTALADAAKASPLLRKLVEVLAARDRLALLGEVAAAYSDLANAAKGIVTAQVISAVPLAAAQQKALVEALAGQADSVELTSEVEPGLVGGLVIRMAGRTYDGSVRTRLAALRRRLAASS
ncbi:MAG TPA: ATP synthase F1 subunit delta [Myxococcota bacterium]|nr:ATP synthase F1 subunit delta [Myxococcota bacterium]